MSTDVKKWFAGGSRLVARPCFYFAEAFCGIREIRSQRKRPARWPAFSFKERTQVPVFRFRATVFPVRFAADLLGFLPI